MKIKFLLIHLFFLASLANSNSQNTPGEKIIITGSRFTYPLLEQWITGFKEVHPEIEFKIIPRGGSNVDSANLVFNAHKLRPEEIKPGYYAVNIARYALLPFANAKNPLTEQWQKKGIKEKDFKKMYFKKNDPYNLQEQELKEKQKDKNAYQPVVYSRAQKACAPIAFSSHYGFEQDDIVGKPIGGDDKHLITAVERDTNGVSYNNLNLLYDVKTRKIKNNISIIPLDLNANGKLDSDENLYGKLDDVIYKLENNKVPEIPVEYINVLYSAQTIETNKNVTLFLAWVFTNGQKYNHDLGFLEFDAATLAMQKEIFEASQNKR